MHLSDLPVRQAKATGKPYSLIDTETGYRSQSPLSAAKLGTSATTGWAGKSACRSAAIPKSPCGRRGR